MSRKHQTTAKVTSQDVQRIIKRDYGENNYNQITSLIDEIEEPEKIRVQVAVLKLGGGDFEKLKYAVQVAKVDYRDVLATAEYPRYFHALDIDQFSDQKHNTVIDSDLEDYTSWLKKD